MRDVQGKPERPEMREQPGKRVKPGVAVKSVNSKVLERLGMPAKPGIRDRSKMRVQQGLRAMRTRIGWMKLAALGAVMLLLVPVSGCVERRVFERLGLIVAVGHDFSSDDRKKLVGTSVLYQLDPDAKDIVTVISNEAETLKGIRQMQNAEASRSIVAGQLRVVLYEDKLASEGIIRLVDTLSRDPSLGTAIYLVVSSGKSAEVLQHRFPEIGNVGTYLYQMIKQNIASGQIPSATLHEFLRAYYSEGSDPVLPYIERVNNEIHAARLALFMSDRMVGSLGPKESAYLAMLKRKKEAGYIQLEIPREKLQNFLLSNGSKQTKKLYIGLQNLHSKPRIKLTNAADPAFKVTLDTKVTLQEISEDMKDLDKEFIQTIEQIAAEHIQTDLESLFAKLQKLKVDPVGFGHVYGGSVRSTPLKKEEWRAKWVEAKFDVSVRVRIERTGVME